jgi:thiol-disulfide isomerase/thioredoxin
LKRNIAVLAGVVVLMGALAASAVLTFRHRQQAIASQPQRVELSPADGSAMASDATAAPTGAGLMPDGSQDLRGKPAPNFSLKSLDGKTVSLSDYRGKAVLVNFWATWCAPCKIEIPWFIKLSQQYAPQGLVVIGVSAEDTPRDEVEKSVKTLGINYPVLLRGDKIGDQWGGLDGLPVSFYINRQGIIADQTVGLYSRDEVEAKIKKILGTPASATQITTASATATGKP